MSFAQGSAFTIIVLGLILFAWGKWRHDVVALFLLLAAVSSGIVPTEAAFAGFGDPVVVTVIAVLIMGRAIQREGIVERLADALDHLPRSEPVLIGALMIAVAIPSAFMNNIGALALMLPVALQVCVRHDIAPSHVMMPIAFASLLGGMVTLIGTPPNIIIAGARAQVLGEPFQMFDFTPVGVVVALTGIAFVVVIGYRLLPRSPAGGSARDQLFELGDYITEVRIPSDSELIGKPVRQIVVLGDGDVSVVALIRRERRQLAPPWYERLQAEDTLLIEGDPTSLSRVLDATDVVLAGDRAFSSETLHSEDVVVVEAVVNSGSRLEGRTARGLRINSRFGVNILAVARQERRLAERIGHIRFRTGDVLLFQGPRATLPETLNALRCLPLAERGVQLGTRRRWGPLIIMTLAVAAAAAGLAPVHVVFMAGVLAMVVARQIPLREAYEAVDWSVVVLLGAMLPVGMALQTTGATDLIAMALVGAAGTLSVSAMLALVIVTATALSAVVNNAATAVVMAPLAIAIARDLGYSVDGFLMAVAVGCSCAFLTPIGHQSNLLVMVPGGYRFGDYWRLGLPLTICVIAVAVPTIQWIWPV